MESQTRLRTFNDLPGPKGVPYFGNALQLGSSRSHQQFEQWAAEYGAIYKITAPRRNIVILGDHELVATMLRDRPDGFRRTTRLRDIWLEMGLPPGVFGSEGEDWKRQRRMVMAGLDPVHVKAYFPSLQAVAARLAKRWHKAAALNAAIALQPDLMRYTVDTIAGLAFGAEVNTLESDQDIIQQHLDKIFPALFRRIFSPIPLWRWFPSRADRELAGSLREVMAAVDGFVAQARANMGANPALRAHPENLLEAMLAAADAPDSGIDDHQVSGNVLTMLLAGEDTTANTLAWMIDLLWRNPDCLQKAVDEVRRVCPLGEPLTMDKMAALDYVEACAHETMRLKPVAPILPLQTLRETVVGDVVLPTGTIVIGLMRRDSVAEEHFPDAFRFEPGRWLAEGANAMQSAKRIAMPFGAGPRICPGRYLALLEMKMAMATLLSNFDIADVRTPDGQPAQEHLSFTMAPVGLSMRLRPLVKTTS